MSVRQFVDTNILLYAHDLDAGDKHVRAASRIRQLWESGEGVLSVQVLQEFYVNITRKIPQPLPLAKARELIGAYSAWQVECPDAEMVLTASDIQEKNQLSFWDAMIVATAVQARAEVLFSEDMNHGQFIEGIRIENPFLH